MKNFKSFINEAGPNAKPKAKGEADFVDAHKVEISDPEEQGTDGSAKVTTKEGSGKRKADRLDNKQAMGEEQDTPGNSYKHQCAIHVKSEQFGEGTTITSQHAEPDENGDIEWYDIMFEHGIEQKVLTSSLEILVSESHMNHKKMKKESVKPDVEKAFPASGVRKHPAPKGTSTMPKDKEKAKGRPAGSFKEEVEEIDEVSKELLARYAKSATVDARMKYATGKDFERIAQTSRKPEYKASAKEWENKYKGIARKRQAGVHKAIDRLAKEEVELDEAKLDVDKEIAKHKEAGAAHMQKYRQTPGLHKKSWQQNDSHPDRQKAQLHAYAAHHLERYKETGDKKELTKHKRVVKDIKNVDEEIKLDEEQLIEMDAKNLPFTPDVPKKNPSAKAGKYGQGPSTAKHLAQQGMKKTLRTMKKSMKEADFSKQQTKMAHTIGKEFEKKGVGDETRGGPYAVASAMVRDKPEAAKKAYKTIQSKMKEEADAELLFNLYNDLNEENQEMFMSQLEEDADSLLEFARMMSEE